MKTLSNTFGRSEKNLREAVFKEGDLGQVGASSKGH